MSGLTVLLIEQNVTLTRNFRSGIVLENGRRPRRSREALLSSDIRARAYPKRDMTRKTGTW
jgi:ABC-type branched-subunit amino acid transport system ATPase component